MKTILIWDNSGYKEINYFFKKKYILKCIDIRSGLKWNGKQFLIFIKNTFLNLKFSNIFHKAFYRFNYVLSWVKFYNSKILITFIDNDRFVQDFISFKYIHKIDTISIQNGGRVFSCLDKFPLKKLSPYSLINTMEKNQLVEIADYIFTISERSYQRYNEKSKILSKSFILGSLRLHNWFFKLKSNDFEIKYDICLIDMSNKYEGERVNSIIKAINLIKKPLKIIIPLKNDNKYNVEKTKIFYKKKLSKNHKIFIKNPLNYSVYECMSKSKVVVGASSTCLIESKIMRIPTVNFADLMIFEGVNSNTILDQISEKKLKEHFDNINSGIKFKSEEIKKITEEKILKRKINIPKKPFEIFKNTLENLMTKNSS